jgi:hypothetical protein
MHELEILMVRRALATGKLIPTRELDGCLKYATQKGRAHREALAEQVNRQKAALVQETQVS